MRRLRLLLLSFTAVFNLLFWVWLCHGYTLKGYLLGYPNTAVVGSVALVALALLSTSVRQTLIPLPVRTLHWQALWEAQTLLVVLPLGIWVLAVALFCLVVAWWVAWVAVASVLVAVGAQAAFSVGVLLASLPSYFASVFLFQGVALVLHEAALPKPLAWAASTLVAVSLVLTFAWSSAGVVVLTEGYAPSCSQRFVSLSGQRALVLERREDWYDYVDLGHAYIEVGLLRKELLDSPGTSEICSEALKLQWSADEKQVTWQIWGSDRHGQWQL